MQNTNGLNTIRLERDGSNTILNTSNYTFNLLQGFRVNHVNKFYNKYIYFF